MREKSEKFVDVQQEPKRGFPALKKEEQLTPVLSQCES